MHWALILVLILGGLILLMFLGLPIALAFLGVNAVAMILMFGGFDGLRQLVLSMYSSVALFSLVPIPLFVLMGDIMFHSGVAFRMMEALDEWIGRVPGRLSLLGVAGGTLFATLSGSSVASTAMLGEILVPRMQAQGYKHSMTIGPILGSGTLAAMIPPSALGVLLASLAKVSVAEFLLAIVLPGIVMALVFAAYIIGRCAIQPEIAPKYDAPRVPVRVRVIHTLKYIVPLGIIIFLVIGVMFLGIATPNEAAALGAFGSLILAFVYNKPSDWWPVVRKSLMSTINVTGMILLILAGATAFSQLLAFSGASAKLVEAVGGFNVPSIVMIMIMQVILIIMGMFMEPLSIMMITIPLMMPIVTTLGANPIWFCALVMLNMEMAAITPPFGMSLFVMKGIVHDVTMGQVYKASYPFFALDILVMALIMIFPGIALWLPGLSG